ncbi:MAG TPA: hypothetical protein DEB39_03625 [Planctomycetaceae bacterium]|nr:hypothetical protein [Planctomycetaceae bacterium]
MTHSFRFLLFLPVMTACAFAHASQATDEYGKMHILIVADTDDDRIGLSVQHDVLRLVRMFETAIPAHRRTIAVLADENFSHENIERYYADLAVAPNDTIFFFFAGHGIFYPEQQPRLSNEDHHLIVGKRLVSRERILNWIESKNAKLNIILSDSCFEFAKPDASLEPCAPEIFMEFDRRVFMNLFFRSSGLVNVNSANADQTAVGCPINGGAFTTAFCKVLTNLSGDGPSKRPPYVGSWNTLFQQVAAEQDKAVDFIFQGESAMDLKKVARSPVPFSPLPDGEEIAEYIVSNDPMETLGFRWKPDNGGLLIDEIRKGDLADWYGLKAGNMIVAVRNGCFTGADLSSFSLDDCLNATVPYPNTRNDSPGKCLVRVRDQNGGALREMVLSTRKKPDTSGMSNENDPPKPYGNLVVMPPESVRVLQSAQLSENGKALLCAYANQLGETCGAALFLFDGRQMVRKFENEQCPISPWECQMSPDGRFALGFARSDDSQANTILLWQFDSNHVFSVRDGDQSPGTMAISPDSSRLAVSRDGNENSSVYDLDEDRNIRPEKCRIEFGEYIHGMSFSNDGSRILLFGEENLGIWDVKTGKRLVHFNGSIIAARIHPDGNRFLLNENREGVRHNVLSLWDVQNGKAIARRVYASKSFFPGTSMHDRYFFFCKFSPQGDFFITGQSGMCVLWNTDQIKPVRRLPSVHSELKERAFAFRDDDKQLLTAGLGPVGSSAMRWETKSGNRLNRFGYPVTSGFACGWIKHDPVCISGGNVKMEDHLIDIFFVQRNN